MGEAGDRLTRGLTTVRGAASELLLRSAVVVAGLLVWQLVTMAIESAFFPTPLEIFGRVIETWFSGSPGTLFLTEEVGRNVAPSLMRLLSGWLLAVALGVGLGLAIGRIDWLAAMLGPIVQFTRAIPPPALVPLFLVLLGIGDGMKVGLIAVGVLPPILLNTIDGVRSVDSLQLDTGRVFGIDRRRRLARIVIPSAMPQIFAGLRVSLAIAVILMVISELVASTDGIGFGLLQAQRGFRIPDMWAHIMLLSILGLALNSGLTQVERRALRWHCGARRRSEV
jgi:ABC-type nitrate/sulfonate/bicarbonate transport system permease component